MNSRCLLVLSMLLLISLSPTNIAASDEPPTLDKNGGTILVYELDARDKLPDGYQPKEMVEAIQRRLDSAKILGVTVKVLKDNRFEIALPRAGNHEANVKMAKDLLAQAGVLEFRIVANEEDDKSAFEAAQKYFATAAKDEKIKETLERLAVSGRPSPAPLPSEGQEFATAKGKFSYTWVELSRADRRTHNLDHAAEQDEQRKADWLKAAEARKQGKPVVMGLGRWLIFSRDCQDRQLTKADREAKRYDYFVLCRDPEKDPKSGKPRALTGQYLTEAKAIEDQAARPAVDVQFNKDGGGILYALTSTNKPSGDLPFYRHLAVILDGQVMTAPRLNGAISERAQISGHFTKLEVQRLVEVLRSGALAAALKPLPVSETAVEPKK